MADLVAERKMIQAEEVKPQAAVTEAVMGRVGQAINFVNTRHYYVKEYCINGFYPTTGIINGVDGFFTYPWAFEIVDIVVKINDPGLSGLTEIDLKWKPETSGVFQSIFSTTPKANNLAAQDSSVRLGVSRAGWTTPILNKTQFNAYDFIRLDLLQVMDAPARGIFVTIFTRPI